MFGVQMQTQPGDNKDTANDDDMMQWLNEIEDSERGASLSVPTVGAYLVFTNANARPLTHLRTH